MKYRALTADELMHFEEDFKHFLIVNGVHAEEWERMNAENPEKGQSLVTIFSDTVLQKVYEKLNYIEFRFEDKCFVFQFDKDQINLVSIHRKENSSLDLQSPETIQNALLNHLNELDFFTSSKKYDSTRELEMHSMIEQGAQVSHQEFWDLLQEIIKP